MLGYFNPLDPNPAIAVRAVFPQSGRSRPEKQPFFHIFPHSSKIEQSKKYLPHMGVTYIKLKPMQKKSFRFGKKVCIGSTLNLGICSKCWGNFEGIWGNPGEIPHIGRKTLGVYRVNSYPDTPN